MRRAVICSCWDKYKKSIGNRTLKIVRRK
uniref:Uncharacterized protein n=1 Tax=Anguilla anguilla TaxID=7936 RepID=A0A0E9UAI9_ANGAN